MAKHVILENYTFTPSTRTVVVNGKPIRREQLVLITEVTTNTVIYNFADSSLNASSYTVSTVNNVETTTIVLTYNTTSMNPSTSKLMIIVDETNETFYPSETLMDANTKLRVSTPQSLIDTDFEYGTQPTKWETISLLNNRPSAFYDYTASITTTAISGNGTRTVTVSYSGTPAVTPSTSTPIFIQDSTDPAANGWYLPATTGAGTFTSAGGSSLAQIALHSATGATTVTGGESILSFFVYTPSVVQQDLTLVRDLGNSILGGGTTTTVPTSSVNLYPDGPDVVTIKVTSLTAAVSSIAARLSWTEAQA
jgi:hypothetical protein